MESTRRPVLFVSHPESGLLNPLLVLAEEMSRRGVEDLHFATDDNRRDEIEALRDDTPVRFVPLGPVVPEMSAVTWDDETYREVTQRSRFKAHRAVIRHTFSPVARIAKYRALEKAVEEIRPALMVVESMCSYGYELAITKKIPFVLGVPFMPSNVLTSHVPFAKSYTGPGFPVPHSGLPYAMSFAQRIANQLFKFRTLAMFMTRELRERAALDQQIRDDLGVSREAAGFMSRIEHAEMVLCYSVPELDYPFQVPEHMRLVGTMVPPLPQAPDDGGLQDWLSARESVVYMGFGTVTRLTGEQVHALLEVTRRLGDRGTHVLWKLPAEQHHLLPDRGELPDNLRVEKWVPSQLDVLAHPNVRLFFTHAGGNGFHEGLHFGKPLVVRPLWVDCDDQAVRGRDLGVSLTLDRPETIDVDDVLDKLTRVLDEPCFRALAERFSRLLHEAGGRERAADLLLQLPAMRDDREARI
ncbi:glycosyltransferase family 1 protein [Saccharopolyspora erythraea]|uniref:glycosyltransferase n=1 Tax=Saccharopolyspora erythraea TaxID=1836 RepID=UPI001BA70FBF|nr:glycosyltransferase [Saccharopolyspora erythraea]QUH01931.1 glycosyltransferase family 1 protein [Saccharopolyspora erythraea]